MDPDARSEFETPVVPDLQLEQAAIGDMFLVSVDREVPPDFLPVDGRTFQPANYPAFMAAMHLTAHLIALPTPVGIAEGLRYIIKVGPVR